MNNTLKINVTTNVQQANSSLKQFQETLQGTGNIVSRVGRIFDKEGNLISKTIASVEQKGNKLYRTIQRLDGNGNLRSLSQSVTDVKNATDNTTSSFLKLKNAISFGALVAGIKMVTRGLFETTTKAIDYSESLNLFNVVFKNIEENGKTIFSEVGKQATEFQKKLQSNFGANRTESMYYQGLYQAMANAQGIADQYANIMSENTTKLTYDLSSLFNKNQDDVAEALRAGIYAGQTKPLRSYGIDITETTLQGTLDKMKETNSALKDLEVSTMSQAEKQILRYISVLDQASVAHGDFANTIDSPANQLKILQNQIIEMGVAVGNLFVGPLQKLLTFANTVVIVIKQVAQAIASLFGVKIKDYNTGIATATDYVDDLSDSYSGVGDSAGKASKKLKELNRQALAFDNINNINENKNNNGSSKKGSGAGGTGINQALLDSLKGYDNGLDKVRLKAQSIADSIMRWLGFTYDAEEGVWKLGKAYDNLIYSCKNLNKSFDLLSKYSFVNLINFYQNFLKPVASWALGTGLPKFVDITANGIMQTDWNNLNNKLNNFYKALTPFSINIGEGLLWFYEKVLVPLGSFTIGKVIPEFVDLLSNGLKILNNTIDTMKPTVTFLWDNFLSPIAKWTGGVALDVLKDINSVFGLIAKSKVASTVTALGTAFLLIKSNGGLAKTTLSLLSKVFGNIEKDAKNTSNSLSDQKSTGLARILNKLKTSATSVLNPIGKLATSIKGASKESNDFSKKTKDSGSILDLFKTKVKNAGNSVKDLGTKLKTTQTNFKGFNTQLSNGIKTWQNTTTGVEKLKTAIVGIGGTVASLHGISNAIKDISEEGANFGNVATTIASGLGTIASSAMTGASIGGLNGAVIGGVLGTVLSLATAIKGLNGVSGEGKTIIEGLNSSYTSFKENMVSTLETYNQAIEQAERNVSVKTMEISKAQELATTMENFVDVNGRVKTGYEERANVILNQLNNALGTEFTLEDGIIKNGEEMISSKTRFIEIVNSSAEAIKKETLMESYQAQYKSAIEAQIDAKKNYNNELANEESQLQKTIKKYEEGKISANDLEIAVEKASTNKQKAEEKYKAVLKDTNKVIDGLSDVTEAYAKGSSKDMENAMSKINSSNNKTTKQLENDWKNVTKTAKEKLKDIQDQAKKQVDSTIKIKFDDKQARQDQRRFAQDYNKAMKNASGSIGSIGYMPAYANGGFPEEGPFYMNRGEIAGKFSNGKSVVANNQQITNGIKYAVMEGMSEVMKAYGGGTTNVQLDITTEEGIIVKKAVKGINRITETTGECPIRVM